MTKSPTVLPAHERQSVFPMQRFMQVVRDGWHWLEHKRAQQTGTRRLRVAETVSLGEKRFVSIVKVDGVEMLIGVSGASVSLLTVLEPQPDAETTRLPDAEANS